MKGLASKFSVYAGPIDLNYLGRCYLPVWPNDFPRSATVESRIS